VHERVPHRVDRTQTHRDDAALAAEADDGVVGARAAGGGVDDDEYFLVLDEREGLRAEHGVDVDLAEDLLQRVEREARELGLDEVRAVLHHDLELAVALGALPLRDEVEHVDLENRKREAESAVVGRGSGGHAHILLGQESDAGEAQARGDRAEEGADAAPGREVRRAGRAAGLRV
jgi:predicted transcriptional regulator